MPQTHIPKVKLPAVSGSSGRLVVESVKEDTKPATYPGQVFADEDLDYSQAMIQFVAESTKADEDGSSETKKTEPQTEKQQLRQEQTALRADRRQVRQHRKQQDAAWKTLKAERKAQRQQRKAQIEAGNRPPWGSQKASDKNFKQLREHRYAQLGQREIEDQRWRNQLQQLRQWAKTVPLVTAWIAILVITDNCTRQCLGLPVFIAGPRVTAEMVVLALSQLLPPELQFLISDRGVHFKANVFGQLVLDSNFIHVVIARHRPESNGIAERFVRTLKEWLAFKYWEDEQQLHLLVDEFVHEYNDRPHQGLAIPGLSPNEFANRIWLM